MRHFITIEEAKEKTIFGDISLLDKDLVVKKPNNDGTYSINPIISLGLYKKKQIKEFSKECKNKGQELLLEVQPKSFDNPDFTDINIQSFDILENNTYYQIIPHFEPRTIRLLEFDVLKQFKKVPEDQYKIVVVLPSKINNDSLFLSEKGSVIAVRDSLNSRREMLKKSRLGSDLYILPKNPDLFNEYSKWLVELAEVEKNVYEMKKRSYYFIKPLSKEELSFLTKEELKIYYTLVNSQMNDTKNPELISLDRTILDNLLEQNENMPFKDIIEEYNQEGLSLNKVSSGLSK